MQVIKNKKEMGRTLINKLAAAERQLAASIRMYFLELDPLAIHTVSSAAHNVLADLLSDRGKEPAVHGVVYGLLRAAKDLHVGEKTEDEIHKWGEGALEIVEQYIPLFEENPDLDIDEVSSRAPSEFVRNYWSKMRSSYNFLKHADRDQRSLLDEAAINNEDTILQAISCSQQLNIKHSIEKHFFYCAMIAFGGIRGNERKPFDLQILFSGLSREEIMAFGRMRLCLGKYTDDGLLLNDLESRFDEARKTMEMKMMDGTIEDVFFFDFD